MTSKPSVSSSSPAWSCPGPDLRAGDSPDIVGPAASQSSEGRDSLPRPVPWVWTPFRVGRPARFRRGLPPPGPRVPGSAPPGGPLAPHAPSSVRSVRLTSESPCPSHRGAVVRGGRARLTMTPRPSTGPTREAACQSRTQTRKRTSPHRVRFCPSRPDPGVTVALDRHAWPAAHSLPFCLLVGPRPPYSTSAPLSLVHSRRCYSPSSPRRVRFQLVLAGGAREPRGRRPRRGRGAPLIRAWWGWGARLSAPALGCQPRTASSRRALRPAPSPGHCQSPRPPPPGR